MRTGGGAAAAENLLASTCYLSRCRGDWELGAGCDQVEGKINGTAFWVSQVQWDRCRLLGGLSSARPAVWHSLGKPWVRYLQRRKG